MQHNEYGIRQEENYIGQATSAGDRGGDRMSDFEIIMVILTIVGLLFAAIKLKDRK